MEEQRFDDLARLVATKTSHRQVLKLLAGAALGGMFANRLSPALAAGGGACAKFCDHTFGKGTPDAKQCIADGRAHTGLCYTSCGPGGTGGILCGGPSYSTTTCCATGTTCVSGTCCANASVCGSGTSAVCGCPSGQCCDSSSNTCVASCSGGGCAQCGSVSVPVYNGYETTCAKPCTDSSQCAAGSTCKADPSGNTYCMDASTYSGVCQTNPGVGDNSLCRQGSICNLGTYAGSPMYVCSAATC